MDTIIPKKPELEDYHLTTGQYAVIKNKAYRITSSQFLNSDIIVIKIIIAIVILISAFFLRDRVQLPVLIFITIYGLVIAVKGFNIVSEFLQKKYINYRLNQIDGYQSYNDYEKSLLFFEYRKERRDEERKKAQEQERLNKERALKRRQYQFWMSLSPYEFEKEIALLFERQGYKASVTKGSGDGGIDILIEKEGLEGIIQCKRFKNKVSPGPIRDLYGTMKAGNHKFGIAVCPSGFSDKAYEFSKGKNIKLIGLKQIMEMVNA
jgi:HJR/Mrr/RecB family endonuclease